jgi:hypothetical protein
MLYTIKHQLSLLNITIYVDTRGKAWLIHTSEYKILALETLLTERLCLLTLSVYALTM